jgi:hypothetical protein
MLKPALCILGFSVKLAGAPSLASPGRGIAMDEWRDGVSFLAWHVHSKNSGFVVTVLFDFALSKPLDVRL